MRRHLWRRRHPFDWWEKIPDLRPSRDDFRVTWKVALESEHE